MSRYYVKKDKLKRLERLFRADIRAAVRRGIPFDPAQPGVKHYIDVLSGCLSWEPIGSSADCGVCAIGARALRTKVSLNDGPGLKASIAKHLRVRFDWVEEIYFGVMEHVSMVKYPDAFALARRLREYGLEQNKRLNMRPAYEEVEA